MEIASIKSAFFNSGSVLLFTLIITNAHKLEITGKKIAAFCMVCGFSFFGKNIINTIPLVIGTLQYINYKKLDADDYIHVICFSTGISPLISFTFFSLDMPLLFSIPLGLVIGIIVGFIIIPISENMFFFHQGYNLYNVGFCLGILGLVINNLFLLMNIETPKVFQVYQGDDDPLIVAFIMIIGTILSISLISPDSVDDYIQFLKRNKNMDIDFTAKFNRVVIMTNMALLGLFCLIYIKLNHGIVNGPTLGAIIAVMGFGAYGIDPVNIFSIFIGIKLASIISPNDFDTTSTLIISLFGTTLAPIPSKYGFWAGVVSGFLHKAIAINTSHIHGGLNLYNNGLSGGLVAGIMIPVLQAIQKKKTTINYY